MAPKPPLLRFSATKDDRFPRRVVNMVWFPGILEGQLVGVMNALPMIFTILLQLYHIIVRHEMHTQHGPSSFSLRPVQRIVRLVPTYLSNKLSKQTKGRPVKILGSTNSLRFSSVRVLTCGAPISPHHTANSFTSTPFLHDLLFQRTELSKTWCLSNISGKIFQWFIPTLAEVWCNAWWSLLLPTCQNIPHPSTTNYITGPG